MNPKPKPRYTQADIRRQEMIDAKSQFAERSLPPLETDREDPTDVFNPLTHDQTSASNAQSNWEAWGNIGAKTAYKTLGHTADAIAGTVVGVGQAAVQLVNNLANLGNVDNDPNITVAGRVSNVLASPIDGFLNNWYSTHITDPGLKLADDAFQVHESEEDANSILPMNLKTVDKIFDGASYIAGTVLAGKGRGLLANTKLINGMSSKAASLWGKLMKSAADEGKTMDDLPTLFKDADELIDIIKNPTVSKFAKKAKEFGGTFNNSLLFGEAMEAGAEGRQTRQEVTDKLTQEYIQANGGKPLTRQQEIDIKDRAIGASVWNFATNMAVLKGTETVGLGLLGKNNWLKDVIGTSNISKVGDNLVLNAGKEAAKKSYMKLFEKTISRPGLQGIIEEGGQEAVQFASNDFFVNLYTHKNTEKDSTNNYFGGAMESVFPALKELGSEIVNNPKEIIESAVVGGLLGFAGGRMGAKAYNKEKTDATKRTQAYLDYSNSLNGKVQESIGNLAAMSANAKAMDGAVFNGDRVVYETLKDKHLVDFVQSRIKVGQYDDAVQTFKDIKDINVDDFNKNYGLDFNEQEKSAFADKLLDAAGRVKESNDKIMTNYGHKIIQLEEAGLKDILPFLIQMDLTRGNLVKRESELIDGFMKKGIDYTEFQTSAVSPEQIQEKKKVIADLYSQIKDIDKNDAIELEDKNKQKKDIFDQILEQNNALSNAVTNENYKEMFQKQFNEQRKFKEEKAVGENAFGEEMGVASVESTPFQEQKGKFNPKYNIDTVSEIKDFIDIQKAKEKTIDLYNSIVSDSKVAEDLQKKIDFKNKKDTIQQLFTINGSIKPTRVKTEVDGSVVEQDSTTDFELGAGDTHSDFIQEGDFFQMKSKIKRARIKGTPEANVKRRDGEDAQMKYSDIYEPVEIIKTGVNNDNGKLSGYVVVRPTGVTDEKQYRTMSVDEFKKSVKPVSKDSVKLPFNKNAKDFYKQFANRAIVAMVDGKERTGFIRPEFLKKNTATEVVDGVVKDKNDDFINASQFRFSFIDENGKMQTVSAKNIVKDYIKVLDKPTSLKHLLQFAINNLVKAKGESDENVKATEENGRWTIYNSDTLKNLKIIARIKQDLASVENLNDDLKLVGELERDAAFYEAKEQLLSEALNYFDETFDSTVAITDPELEKAYERLSEFDRVDEIHKETEKLNKEQAKAVVQAAVNEAQAISTDEEIQNARDQTTDLKKAIQDKLETAPDEITSHELFQNAKSLEAKIIIANDIDPAFIDTIPEIADYYEAIDKYYRLSAEKNQKYYEELAALGTLSPEQLRDIKLKERKLTLNFINFLQSRGFQYATEYVDPILKTDEFKNETDTDAEFDENGFPSDEQQAHFQEKQRLNNEKDLIVTSGYDTRKRKVVAPENAEEAFFHEVAHDGFAKQTKMRVLRLTDLEKPEFKEVYDNLPDTTKNPLNKDGSAIDRNSILLVIATDDAGKFRKTKEGNYIVTKYPKQAATDKRLNKQRQTIDDILNVSTDQPSVFVDVKPATSWLGGFIRSTVPQTFSKTKWGGGRFELPTTENNSKEYQGLDLKPGSLYFRPDNSNTYIPVGVGMIGDKSLITAESNGSLSVKPLSIVDNFLMGMKYLAQNPSKKDVTTFNNNFLNLLFYSKDGVFQVKFSETLATPTNPRGIHLEVGDQIIDLKDEQGIRDAVSHRLFNPSSKLLDKYKDKVMIASYYSKDGSVHVAMKQVVNNKKVGGYESLLEQFDLNTFADRSLYRNGSIELGDVKAGIEPKTPKTQPTGASTARFGIVARRKGAVAALDQDPAGTGTPIPDPTVTGTPVPSAPVRKNPGAKKQITLVGATPTPVAPVPVPKPGIGNAPAPKIRRRGLPLSPETVNGRATRPMSEAQLAKAQKLLSKYGVDVQIVSGLIDGDAWGLTLQSGDVLLSDKAISGTQYHEEFHIVSQHILSEDELEDLYSEQRKRYPGLSDIRLEESLAEEFRMYRNGYEGLFGKIKYYFNKLLSAIKGIRGIEADRANLIKDQLFRNIYEGRYQGNPIHTSTVDFYSQSTDGIRLAEKRKIYNQLSIDIVASLLDNYKITRGFVTDETKAGDDAHVVGNCSFLNDSTKRNEYLNEKTDGENPFDYFLNAYFENEDNALELEGTTLEAFDAFKDSFKPEFKQFLAKKIGFRIADVDALSDDELNNEDEANETGSNQIVKKGDEEYDHALDAVNQMNLLSLFSANGGEFITLTDFVGSVYNNIGLSYDYATFVDNIDGLNISPKYDGILGVIRDINHSDSDSVDVVAFRNKLFSLFSKQENKFLVLKRFGNGEMNFLNQSHSQLVEQYKDKFKNEFTQNIGKFAKKKVEGSDVLAIFGIDKVDIDLVLNSLRNEGNIKSLNHIRDSINRKLATGKNIDIDSLFKFSANDSNERDIRKVIESLIGLEENQRMFSVYNAEGNSQYALSNFSSLAKILEDRKDSVDIDEIVLLNGIQKEGESGSELDKVLLNKATEHDLHISTIRSVLDQNVVPFVFNGDKSSFYGIQMKERILSENDFWEIFKEEANDLVDYQRLVNQVELAPNAFNMTTFGFMAGTEKYDAIKKQIQAGATVDFNTVRDGIKVGNVSITRDEVMDARRNYVAKIIDSYDSDIRDDLDFGDEYDEKMKEFVDKYQYSIFEQQKLIGKLYFYKDPTKRTSAWNSAKLNMNLSDQFLESYKNKYGTDFQAGNLRTLVTEGVHAKNFTNVEGMHSPNFDFGDADDAQAHMTPEAYRFVMQASGFWNQTIEDAYNVLEYTDDIVVANEALSRIHEQVSVLKLQYYDLRDVDGVDVPTFYKYSVVPLFKVLTKGKNIDKLREFMVQNDIHQHVADTANKIGRNKIMTSLYNSDGSWNELVSGEYVADDSIIQTSPWKGLGIQVQMPMPHDRVTFGTQMRKLIDEDIEGEYLINGKVMSADAIRAKHNELIETKIANDVDSFKNSFGLNDDFKLKDRSDASVKKFKKKLTKEISKRDVSLEFLKQLEYYQTFDGITSKAKLQYMLNSSIRNQIISQKMKGDMKAMMSSVGFENGSIQYSNRLKFYEYDADGTTKGMEVLIPLTPEFEKYVTLNPETNLYEWNDKISDEVKTMIGYRIPTQSQASIDKIFVKAFLPPAIKNIVVVPFEVAKKTGGDYDIDKMQMYYPTFKEITNDKTKKKYIQAASLTKEQELKLLDRSSDEYANYVAWAEDRGFPLKNKVYDKGHIDNQIIEFYSALLGSSRLKETMTSTIDNDDIKRLIKIREAELISEEGLVPNKAEKENGWELANPYYSIRRRGSFLQGKYALGATALAATHHAESQKTKLSMNDQNKIGDFKLSELLTRLTGDGNWTEVRGGNTNVIPLDRIVGKDGNKISDYLSQLINACVDVARDDYITSANYNLETSSVATSLLRMGVSPADVIRLISDRDVIMYIRGYQKGASLLGDYKTMKEKPKNASGMLKLYLDIQNYTNELNSLMQISNFDTKGNGKTVEENEAIAMKVADAEAKGTKDIQTNGRPLRGKFSKLAQIFMKGDSPMESSTTGSFLNGFRTVVENANNFNSIVFDSNEWFINPVTDSQKQYANQLRSIYNQAIGTDGRIPKGIATVANEASKFKNTLISYLMQQRYLDTLKKKDASDIVANSMASLPFRLNKLKKTSDNLFLQQLLISPQVVARRAAGVEYVMDSISLKDSTRLKIDQIDEITEAFYDLYADEATKEIAKDIAVFSMFQSGIVNSPITINNLIPLRVTRDLLSLQDGRYFLNDLMQAIDTLHTPMEIKNMMVKANPIEPLGKMNTIYFRSFNDTIIKKVNSIIKGICK